MSSMQSLLLLRDDTSSFVTHGTMNPSHGSQYGASKGPEHQSRRRIQSHKLEKWILVSGPYRLEHVSRAGLADQAQPQVS